MHEPQPAPTLRPPRHAALHGKPFDPVAITLLIRAAQAEGDHEGALAVRDYALRRYCAELPPEPW